MNIEKFIYEGSPFVPELREMDIQLLLMQSRIDTRPWPLQIALRLAVPDGQFEKCFRNLASNINSLASFGATLDKLESYKLGYLAPFLTIRLSCEEEIQPGTKDMILEILASKWGFGDDFTAFIKSKVPTCQALINKKAREVEYFYLTSMFWKGDPDFYFVGIGAAKLNYSECLYYLDKYGTKA